LNTRSAASILDNLIVGEIQLAGREVFVQATGPIDQSTPVGSKKKREGFNFFKKSDGKKKDSSTEKKGGQPPTMGSISDKIQQFFRNEKTQIVITLSVALFFLSFAIKRQDEKRCQQIEIEVSNDQELAFLTPQSTRALISGSDSLMIIGSPFSNLSLRKIEGSVKASPYTADASVYRSLNGNLIVSIVQERPLARIIREAQPDLYIAENGRLFSESSTYSARCMTLFMPGSIIKTGLDNLNQSVEGKGLLQFIRLIDQDAFWKALISGISYDRKGQLLLYPQMGDQRIEFGKVENEEQQKIKLIKLKAFYTQIIPSKGWGRYHIVKLQYDNQIICE
jgi:cell division protein FtsQ